MSYASMSSTVCTILSFSFSKLIDAVPTQHLFEMLHVREVSGREMVFPLHLFHMSQASAIKDVAQKEG
jgi:hypothetical protein